MSVTSMLRGKAKWRGGIGGGKNVDWGGGCVWCGGMVGMELLRCEV